MASCGYSQLTAFHHTTNEIIWLTDNILRRTIVFSFLYPIRENWRRGRAIATCVAKSCLSAVLHFQPFRRKWSALSGQWQVSTLFCCRPSSRDIDYKKRLGGICRKIAPDHRQIKHYHCSVALGGQDCAKVVHKIQGWRSRTPDVPPTGIGARNAPGHLVIFIKLSCDLAQPLKPTVNAG